LTARHYAQLSGLFDRIERVATSVGRPNHPGPRSLHLQQRRGEIWRCRGATTSAVFCSNLAGRPRLVVWPAS
jgi:hypothetical protein